MHKTICQTIIYSFSHGFYKLILWMQYLAWVYNIIYSSIVWLLNTNALIHLKVADEKNDHLSILSIYNYKARSSKQKFECIQCEQFHLQVTVDTHCCSSIWLTMECCPIYLGHSVRFLSAQPDTCWKYLLDNHIYR